MSPSRNSNTARAAARLFSLSWKPDGGPTLGTTFSSNSRRTSSHNALMHPFSTFGLPVRFRQFDVARHRQTSSSSNASILFPFNLRLEYWKE